MQGTLWSIILPKLTNQNNFIIRTLKWIVNKRYFLYSARNGFSTCTHVGFFQFIRAWLLFYVKHVLQYVNGHAVYTLVARFIVFVQYRFFNEFEAIQRTLLYTFFRRRIVDLCTEVGVLQMKEQWIDRFKIFFGTHRIVSKKNTIDTRVTICKQFHDVDGLCKCNINVIDTSYFSKKII